MTKAPATLDAITDAVLTYRPKGMGENAAAVARKPGRAVRDILKEHGCEYEII